MRAALWFLALFGIAVAMALFAGNNQGTVTVYWPPYRVDVSLNLVLLALVGSMVVLYFATRAMAGLVDLPRRARIWRNQQKERAMHEALLGGTTYLMAGRYARAQKSALLALGHAAGLTDRVVKTRDMPPHTAQNAAQTTALAHLLVASSAHALQDKATRDQHLQDLSRAAVAEGVSPATLESAQLRAARWALDDHAPQRALDLIAALPHGLARRTAALRIKLKAARLSGDAQSALETARLLAKHGAFSPDAAQATVRAAALDCIRQARDGQQLDATWASLSAAERLMPELAIEVASSMLRFKPFGTPALDLLLPIWERYVADPDAFSQAVGVGVHLKWVQTLARALGALNAPTGTKVPNTSNLPNLPNLPNLLGTLGTTEGQAQAQADIRAASQAWLGRLELAQGRFPRTVALQFWVGVSCHQRELWGKAQQMLTLATPNLTEASLLRQVWCLRAELAERQGDAVAALHAWKQAAMQAV